MMNETIFDYTFGKYHLVLNGWKLIGYFGVIAFSLRWVTQFFATKRAGKVVMPMSFWLLSVFGSLAQLSYFLFYRSDSVGILSMLFPSFVAIYNLYKDLKHRAHRHAPEA
jgi:lipid-A-disaccharide synthase-like uncharacterized protein